MRKICKNCGLPQGRHTSEWGSMSYHTASECEFQKKLNNGSTVADAMLVTA